MSLIDMQFNNKGNTNNQTNMLNGFNSAADDYRVNALIESLS